MLLGSCALLFASAAANAKEVRDWQDLYDVHEKVQQAIRDGLAPAEPTTRHGRHGEKAEQLLRQAEHELDEAVEAAKHAK